MGLMKLGDKMRDIKIARDTTPPATAPAMGEGKWSWLTRAERAVIAANLSHPAMQQALDSYRSGHATGEQLRQFIARW